jgi:hypothetical protein
MDERAKEHRMTVKYKNYVTGAPLTQEFLKSQLRYDPETGVFGRIPGQVHGGGRLGSVGGFADGYLVIGVGGRRYQAHRLAWLYVHGEMPKWPAQQIDHINGDRSDNRISNLRLATGAVNTQNMRGAHGNNKNSGLLGAHKSGTRWQSVISVHGKNHHLGVFSTPEEAHAAYVTAKRVLHPGCTL